MKTKTLYLILIIVVVLAFAYVYLNDDKINVNEPNTTQDTEPGNEVDNQKVIRPISASEKDISNYTLLEEYQVDFNNDSVEDKVELYAQVGVTEDGEYMWDDGQRWLLLARTGDSVYIIFDDYVQLGRLYVKLYESYEDNSVHLTTVLEVGAAYVIKDYTYSSSDDNFKEELILEQSNINWIQRVYH